MPWWMVLYLILFGLMAVCNIGYLVFIKSKLFILIYEIFSCSFLFLMMIAYWDLVFRAHLNLLFIPVFALIMAIDIKITVFGDIHDLGIEVPEDMTQGDIKTAGALSLIFTAPAYILCGLLCLESI